MKKYRIPQVLSLIIISMIFFTIQSCKDVDSSLNPKDDIDASQIISDPFKYTQDNLTKIGIGVLNSSKKSNFRIMLYEEIEKKFDGDNDVLIKTLEENSAKMNINFVQSIADGYGNSSAKLAQAQNAMDAFKSIEKQEYYPQVFIPFYEEKKQKGKLGMSNPIIVIFNGDEKNGIQNGFTGYTFDSNGKIVTISNIKEEYAKNNEVWVISLNERTVSTPQGMRLKKERLSNITQSEKSSKTASTTVWEWQFSTMTVWVDKDSGWFMGDSEVCFKAVVDFFPVSGISSDYLYKTNDCILSLGDFSVGNAKGNMNIEFVKSFKESDYFNFANDYIGNDVYNGSQNMYYAIYEDDNWPAGERVASFSRVGGGIIEIQYRSADDFYDIGTLASADALFWSQINWNAAPPTIGINRGNSEITYRMKVLP